MGLCRAGEPTALFGPRGRGAEEPMTPLLLPANESTESLCKGVGGRGPEDVLLRESNLSSIVACCWTGGDGEGCCAWDEREGRDEAGLSDAACDASALWC